MYVGACCWVFTTGVVFLSGYFFSGMHSAVIFHLILFSELHYQSMKFISGITSPHPGAFDIPIVKITSSQWNFTCPRWLLPALAEGRVWTSRTALFSFQNVISHLQCRNIFRYHICPFQKVSDKLFEITDIKRNWKKSSSIKSLLYLKMANHP